MKNILFIVFGLLVLKMQSQSIKVNEGSSKFSVGSQNALKCMIYENKLDDVMHEWKKIMKDYKHEKVKDHSSEIFGDNIVVKDWGNNPVDVYASFEENEKEKSILVSVAVDLGGIYLSSNKDKDKFKYFEKVIKEFCLKMTLEPIEAAVKMAEKSEHKLEDNQKDLEKENKNLKDDIENYKEKIKKAEDGIKKNEEDQVKKKAEIEAQKKVTEELKKKLKKFD
ncbi:MAG: hypothetical protein IPM51_14515 [Sphingobacteriaceae bacterium]|nr:hypothetical protein [Sphingobacteriaceae bacterium]